MKIRVIAVTPAYVINKPISAICSKFRTNTTTLPRYCFYFIYNIGPSKTLSCMKISKIQKECAIKILTNKITSFSRASSHIRDTSKGLFSFWFLVCLTIRRRAVDYKIGMYVTLINWEKRILDIQSIQLLEFRYFYVYSLIC